MQAAFTSAATEKPWLAHFGSIPAELHVPENSMYERVRDTAEKYPDYQALDYMGKCFTFAQFIDMVDASAKALSAMGVKKGDTVTLSLPNIPNTLALFYALNKLGARASMTHPLSTDVELARFVSQTNSRFAVTCDLFFGRFKQMLLDGKLEKLVIAHIPDYLPAVKKIGFAVTKGRKIAKVPAWDNVIQWKDFLKAGAGRDAAADMQHPKAGSVVLFSGGTSELPKGILLSSYNFNALAVSSQAITGYLAGDSILAILPVFHGFGLGLCVHMCLTAGGKVVLVPEFSTKNYIVNLIKHKPEFIAGVPTLFEALMRDEKFKEVDFSRLKGAYSGGDSLSPSIKRRFDEMIMAQGAKVGLKEGYGLTETVTACVISPDEYRENSIGLPLPNILAKVCEPNTERELAYGEEGEICVTGPTLMLEYLGAPEATAEAIKTHADGITWLHTGDLGSMDKDGYIFFKSRIKRMLKVSGMAVYPAQVEQVLESHPLVFKACVIGVPDEYQMTSVKAFVILNDKNADQESARNELMDHCKKHLIKWSVPRVIEFKDILPQTLVGKVAYTQLEREETDKRLAVGN